MVLISRMPIELLGEVSIYVGIGIQVLMALTLGGLVGYDREIKLKSAGIKTNILICLGATLYTSIGILISVGATGMADPNRVAAQVVTGIGFLGAGAIWQSKGSVVGMTTAATIWVVAAIGFTVGAGYPFTAAFFTVTVLLVLKMINPLYKFIENKKDHEYFQLEILSKGSVEKTVIGILESEGFTPDEIYEEPYGGKKGARILSVFLLAHKSHMEHLVFYIQNAIKVREVAYYSVSQSIHDADDAGESSVRGHKKSSDKKNGKSKSEDSSKKSNKEKS